MKERIIRNLEGFSFEEILSLLKEHDDPDVRGTLMDAMEKYFPQKFYKWIEEN